MVFVLTCACLCLYVRANPLRPATPHRYAGRLVTRMLSKFGGAMSVETIGTVLSLALRRLATARTTAFQLVSCLTRCCVHVCAVATDS